MKYFIVNALKFALQDCEGLARFKKSGNPNALYLTPLQPLPAFAQSLQILSLAHQNLQTLPSLPFALHHLDLAHNQLSRLDELAPLVNLRSVLLSNNLL